MYLVQRGICYVNINDKVGLDAGLKRVRILYPGDHFGVSQAILPTYSFSISFG